MIIRHLLLDRDGTLIRDAHYLSDPDGVKLLPGVADTLCALAGQGMSFYLVSNQSGIGRGMFPADAAHAVNERMASLLAPYGVHFSDMLFCPHAPEDRCDCRKPAPGMWRQLQGRHNLDPGECLMVGDKKEDMRFAAAAGLALRALVYTGKGKAAAASLGIRLPGRTFLEWTAAPPSPAHPHFALPSFSMLRKAMELISMNRGG